MKIAIVGSRRRFSDDDQMSVIKTFDNILTNTTLLNYKRQYGDIHLVSGGCSRGADIWADTLAKIRGTPITTYHAAWQLYGRGAGPIRNTFIAKDSDILIACVAPDRTGGTEDTIRKFKEYHPDGKLIIV